MPKRHISTLFFGQTDKITLSHFDYPTISYRPWPFDISESLCRKHRSRDYVRPVVALFAIFASLGVILVVGISLTYVVGAMSAKETISGLAVCGAYSIAMILVSLFLWRVASVIRLDPRASRITLRTRSLFGSLYVVSDNIAKSSVHELRIYLGVGKSAIKAGIAVSVKGHFGIICVKSSNASEPGRVEAIAAATGLRVGIPIVLELTDDER